MPNQEETPPQESDVGTYRWPWFLLAAVILGVILAVIWMSREVQRTRRIRDLNNPPPASTNAVVPGTPAGFSQTLVWL